MLLNIFVRVHPKLMIHIHIAMWKNKNILESQFLGLRVSVSYYEIYFFAEDFCQKKTKWYRKVCRPTIRHDRWNKSVQQTFTHLNSSRQATSDI